MKKLTKDDFWKLSDRWIFMDIAHFMDDACSSCITDYDGCGQYVYIDDKCNLYTDEYNYINFSELAKYDYFTLDEFIKKKSTEDYHLIGVFWYNK